MTDDVTEQTQNASDVMVMEEGIRATYYVAERATKVAAAEWRTVARAAEGGSPAGAGTALAGAGSGRCSATGVAQRRVAGAGTAAWARAGGRSHYENRRKSGLSL